MNNFYIYFFTNLTLLFVGAKLFNFIHWQWFWVVSPMIVMAVVGTIYNIYWKVETKDDRPEALRRIQKLLDEADRK